MRSLRRFRVIAFCMAAAVLAAGCGNGGQKEETGEALENQEAAETQKEETETQSEETETQSEETETQNEEETAELNIAYQYGLAYAPAVVAWKQGLIEKAYEEATGGSVSINWVQMTNGADINTAMAAGELDAGFTGVAPAVTGMVQGVGFKIFTNLSDQEYGFMTNDESLASFDDFIGSDNQITTNGIGSISHIILALALQNAGYDPHALDNNLVSMAHPDGMAALKSKSVAGQVTSSPYIYQEREDENLHEIEDVANTWGAEDSFIVGIATETLHDDNPALYQALCSAIEEAMNFINENPEEAAKLTHELDGTTEEEELAYMEKSNYTMETNRVYELAVFMKDAGFIETAPASYEDMVFENVTGN